MGFPERRLRRLRRSETARRLVRETRLSADRFIYPMFVMPGEGVRQEVASMPGIHRQTVDRLVEDAREAFALGVPGVILFGLPPVKDARGSGADDPRGVVPSAVRALKRELPDLLVLADVCMCEYTDHGHCGIVEGNEVLNDPTLARLTAAAVAYAEAGCDVVAPSDMMDGRVAAIRRGLDENGFADLPILSYAAKYCSGFYGPFRDAADSAPKFGDRRSYQMDPPNVREALEEVALDIEEGADMVMVKPAMPYLDVVRAVRERFNVPLAAYQVSGEYAMIKAAARNGWLDHDRVMMEALTGIVRAGADFVLTYFAKEAARLLRAGLRG
ncbi:MAG: porphobilinogen synthase [Planctomycetes bacterium]|nr:porphobilinogen synthase [Planctomycetota bacterium]